MQPLLRRALCCCIEAVRRYSSAWGPLPLLVVIGLVLPGCAAPPDGVPTQPRCQIVVWYRPQKVAAEQGISLEDAARPELLGDWNGWRRPGLRDWARITGDDGTDWRRVTLSPGPGPHLYGILTGGRLLLDERNPQTAFIADPFAPGGEPFGTEVSRAVLPDCQQPALQLDHADATPARAQSGGALRVVVRFQPAASGAPPGADLLAELSRSAGASQGLPAPPVRLGKREDLQDPGRDPGDAALVIETTGLDPGKYTLRVSARDQTGAAAAPLTTTAFIEPAPTPAALDLPDAVVYQLMVDRFRGSGPLSPPRTPGERAGGTLGGVLAAVQAGYFQSLGVNTLWLSPVYQNPPGRFIGRDGHTYESYHGYWPTAPRAVEPLFGGEAGLDALVGAAHARGLRVILDMVPNHVFQDHPYYIDHSRKNGQVAAAPDPRVASWFHDGPTACVCGNTGCGWGDHIETCWFDRYLPDLNWRHEAVMAQGSADLLWWLQRFDLDGFRIDAVPMMPRPGTRRMMRTLREGVRQSGLGLLLLGETYTGVGDDGRAQIRAFLGAQFDGLDTQFDFPLMWTIRDVVAHNNSGFDALEREIKKSDQAFTGLSPGIAHILNNHDTPRFLSEAAGDGGNSPWDSPPPQPTTELPYQRHQLGVALLLTLPGVPILYYGDELGLAGANDPDCRRPLPDVLTGAGLLPQQKQVLQLTQRLGRLRQCVPTLRRGVRTAVYADADHDVAQHTPRPPSQSAGTPGASSAAPGEAQAVIVVLSRAAGPAVLQVSGLVPGSYRDVLSGRALTIESTATTSIPAAGLQAAVYLPEGHPCL